MFLVGRVSTRRTVVRDTAPLQLLLLLLRGGLTLLLLLLIYS